MRRFWLFILLLGCYGETNGDPRADRQLRSTVSSLSPLVAPRLNQRDLQLAALGRMLFHDQRLSLDGTVSCASCHQPDRYFTDNQPTSFGLARGDRNTPTVVNAFALGRSFWDGRADNLASQALGPLENTAEHGISRLKVYRLVAAHYANDYAKIFNKLPRLAATVDHARPAFPKVGLPLLLAESLQRAAKNRYKNRAFSLAAKRTTLPKPAAKRWIAAFERLSSSDVATVNQVFANIGLAIAAFERSIVAVNSPFDQFVASWQRTGGGPPTTSSFTGDALAGLKLFTGRAGCTNCHHGSNFTDNQFHNIGVPSQSSEDFGRALGLQMARQDVDFGCNSPYYQQISWLTQTESCAEKKFLNGNDISLVGAFKTPSLRNVAKTAPYFHNGSAATLQDAVAHYSHIKKHQAILGHRSESLPDIDLSIDEQQQIVRFLETLTAPISFIGVGSSKTKEN